ncbi:MAG: flagellar protein FlgN [Catonella sp.]|uniref:flagellar protein FlgN n=1 Tax=Catonella sp. TaxID=2382125 RepID=UPI003FA15B54
MASLIEELIRVLSDEEKIYSEIIPIAEKKTQIIVNNDLQSLTGITEEEQELVGKISKLEKKRQEVIRNIGIVMNKKESELNFITIIDLLKGQETEQEELRNLHDKLKRTIETLDLVNERNQMLIKQSLEMIDFDINLIQSLRSSPGLGQYNTASEVEVQGMSKGIFDAKS